MPGGSGERGVLGRGSVGAKAKGSENLGTSGQGEQSHVASSSLDVRGRWSEVGLERFAGDFRGSPVVKTPRLQCRLDPTCCN